MQSNSAIDIVDDFSDFDFFDQVEVNRHPDVSVKAVGSLLVYKVDNLHPDISIADDGVLDEEIANLRELLDDAVCYEYDDSDLTRIESGFLQKILEDGTDNMVLPEDYVHQGFTPSETLFWLAHHSTDEQLINFFQYLMHELQEIASAPEIQDELTEQRENWADAFRQTGLDRVIHPSALQKIDDFGDDAFNIMHRIVFSDSIRLQADSHYAARAQVTRTAPYEIEFGEYSTGASTKEQKAALILETVKKSSFHEFNHAVLGRFMPLWLNEALTEHIAQVLHGQRHIDDVDPGEDVRSYPTYRRILSHVIKMANELSDGEISIDDFIYAYSSNNPDDASNLLGRVNEMFGFDIFTAIEKQEDIYVANYGPQFMQSFGRPPNRKERTKMHTLALKHVKNLTIWLHDFHHALQSGALNSSSAFDLQKFWDKTIIPLDAKENSQ